MSHLQEIAKTKAHAFPAYDPSHIRYATQAQERDDFVRRLMKAPAVDAVEVVRCENCKLYKTKHCAIDIWTTDITIYKAKPDGYCSFGIPKEEGANAREKVHGYWCDANPGDSLDPRMRCSVCGRVSLPLADWAGCPYCLTDMRGEDHE